MVVSPMKPEDLPVIKMLIHNGVCKKASVAFVRDKEEALHGYVEQDLRNTFCGTRYRFHCHTLRYAIIQNDVIATIASLQMSKQRAMSFKKVNF